MLISILSGNFVALSALVRRSMKGLSIRCSICTTMNFAVSLIYGPDPAAAAWVGSVLKLNQLSNSSLSLKTFGIRKFNRLHSSIMSFCSGVPVSNSLRVELILRASPIVRDSVFLSLWASSKHMRYQLKCGLASSGTLKMASYVVTQTSNWPLPIWF